MRRLTPEQAFRAMRENREVYVLKELDLEALKTENEFILFEEQEKEQEKEQKPEEKKKADKNVVLELYNKGMTQTQIAKEVGCSVSTVNKWINAQAKLEEVDAGKIIALHEAGWTLANIVSETGEDLKTVRAVLKEHYEKETHHETD